MYMLNFVNSCILTTSRIVCSRGCKKNKIASCFSLMSNMPKKSKEKAVKKLSVSPQNASVTSVSLEVIGSGANGVPANVMITTNYGSYLINCGEGTMKLANEYKIKVHKSQGVFITYPSWDNISGLLGYALALQEAGGSKLMLHGDVNVGDMFSLINKFVNLRRLQVSVQNCSHYQEYSDGIMSVKYVFLHPSVKRNFPNSSVPLNDGNKNSDIKNEPALNSSLKKTKNEKNLPSKTGEMCESQAESQKPKRSLQYAISYIYKTECSLGPLNYELCLEHGVPPGPLLGQLKMGNDVTLPNGKVVRSKDVKDPDIPGVNIVAIQCPTEEYLDGLLEEPAFQELQTAENPVAAVVHFTSSKVVKNLKYQEWVSRFPKTTLHLFINEDNKRTGSVAIHRQQYKLNFLHPDIFPLLDDSGIPHFPRTDNSFIQDGHTEVESSTWHPGQDRIFFKCDNKNFIYGETLCHVPLKPKPDYDYSRCLMLKKEVFFQEMFESEEIREKIEESKNEIKTLEEKIESCNRIYPKIVFLGTGSSKPSKVRNASGILIFLSSSKCIMLDCGEYTYGQLINFYGPQKAREILRNLQAIYISHMHLDHQLGLVKILKERKCAFDELNAFSLQESEAKEVTSTKFSPVYVLAPSQLTKLLTWFSEYFEDISKLYTFVPNSNMLVNNDKSNSVVENCKKMLDMKSINTVSVHHCVGSFGVSMVHEEGWKITYSGDTKPCQALVDIGMNSDILIHEATLEDAYIIEASEKQHSTTTQAIDVGKAMKAKYILLTHFSQRYCHLPNIDSSFSNSNTGIAFDFMEVPFNKLPLLPALIKPLQYSLSKYDEMNKSATHSFLLRREKIRKADLSCFRKDSSNPSGTPAKVAKLN